MGHPMMYSEEDPLYRRLQRICLALPGVAEKISHGRPQWFTARIFASYGGKVKGEHSHPLLDRALLFLPDPEDSLALEQDPRIYVPAYIGHRGWRALPLDIGEPDWGEVSELVEASYLQFASRRLISELDARHRRD